MNDFIASLIAAAAFCGAYALLGLLTRLAILVEWAPSGTAEGSFLQLALAVTCGALTRHWLVRRPLRETDTRHA